MSLPAPAVESRPATPVRDRRLDVGKGVLIVLVVLGHYLEAGIVGAGHGGGAGFGPGALGAVLAAIYLVHIPAFVVLAGVTARARGTGRRAVELLTLLVVFHGLYTGLRLLLGQHVEQPFTVPFLGLWFLLALALWTLTAPLVARAPRSMLAVSATAAVVSGVLPFEGVDLSWARALYFWPFFVLGQVVRHRLTAPTRAPSARLGAGAGLVLLLGLAAWSGVAAGWTRGNEAFAELGVSTLEGLGGRVVALVASAVAVVCLLVVLPAASRVLEVLGRRSLAVYVLHLPWTMVLVRLVEVLGFDGWSMVAATVAATVATVAVLGGWPVFDRLVRAIGRSVSSRLPAPSRG